MKICFVSPGAYVFFNPSSTHLVGGAEKQMYLIANFLAKDHTNEVSFCVSDFGQGKCEQFGRICTYRTFKYTENKIVGLVKLMQAFRQSGADVFVFRGAGLGVALAALLLKTFLRKRKLVYMMANSDEPVPRKLARMIGNLSAFLMGRVYQLADGIAVQTDEQAAKLMECRKLAASAHVRNIVDIPDASFIDRKTVLWVGRAVKWKQPHIFLDLAEQFVEYQFVMICPENFDSVFYDEIKQRAITIPNLVFLGAVSPDSIGAYYSNARLYMITSISEGFPNTMLEAFSFKVPILSLGIDPDAIVERHHLGMVVHTYEELCSGLSRLMADSVLLSTMSSNAREYVERYHSEEAVGGNINCLLENLS